MSQGRPETNGQLSSTEQFLNLANMPVGSSTLFDTWIVRTHMPNGKDSAWQYARNVQGDADLAHLYEILYPDADEKETYAIAACDAFAINALSWLGNDSRYDPSRHMYECDKRAYDRLTFGVKPSDIKPESIPEFPRSNLIPELPAYQRRIEQGMPKEMQLFLAASAMDRLINRSDWLQISANMLYDLPQALSLTLNETIAVTEVAVAKNPGLVSIVVSDERLRRRYGKTQGEVLVIDLGEEVHLAKTAEQAFLNFLAGNGEGDRAQEWINLESAMSDRLTLVLPFGQRKELAATHWRAKPALPHNTLRAYVTPGEAAQLSRLYVSDVIADYPRHDGAWGLSHAAISLNCPQSVIDAAVYRDYQYLFSIIEEHAPEDDAELHSFADRYRVANESSDEEVLSLVKDYRDIVRTGDLYWPVDGWSGAPEEDEIARSMGQKRSSALMRVDLIKAELKAKLSP